MTTFRASTYNCTIADSGNICHKCNRPRANPGMALLAAGGTVILTYEDGSTHEIEISPTPDLCYGTGDCASKQCPTCGWMIPAGQEHDCAKLAGITGKSGPISRHALMEKYQAFLIQARKDAEQLELDYRYSVDEDGQPHASFLTEVTTAMKKAIDEVARLVWD